VANQYRSEIAELQQGVLNASNGTSTLQIIDGGLNNISTILDRLETLATESASATFAGNRSTLNEEYQSLTQEITRQANNIGLAAGGQYNALNPVFIGGGNTAANGQVSVNLAGPQNQVDAAGLGLATTSVGAGGTELTQGTANTLRLDAPGATFLSAVAQAFTFNIYSAHGGAQTITVSVGGAGALTETQVLSSLNGQLNQYGISAFVGANGQLGFGGGTPFTVKTGATLDLNPIATAGSEATNTGVYEADGAATALFPGETLTFQNGQGTANVTLTNADNLASAISKINSATSSLGIYAVTNAAGSGISIQSVNNFTVASTSAAGVLASKTPTTNTPASTGTVTGNATAALAAITNAIQALGLVQGSVGAGENLLNYASSLANSQITNLSSAQSAIRDADVATAAANLTKAQTLLQSSIAALAQANAAPSAILKLLQ
jgi:flagellin